MGLISRVTNSRRGNPPDLIVASAYSRDEFAGLMREGASLNGRDLGLMGEVARDRFGAFTDEEITALYDFPAPPCVDAGEDKSSHYAQHIPPRLRGQNKIAFRTRCSSLLRGVSHRNGGSRIFHRLYRRKIDFLCRLLAGLTSKSL